MRLFYYIFIFFFSFFFFKPAFAVLPEGGPSEDSPSELNHPLASGPPPHSGETNQAPGPSTQPPNLSSPPPPSLGKQTRHQVLLHSPQIYHPPPPPYSVIDQNPFPPFAEPPPRYTSQENVHHPGRENRPNRLAHHHARFTDTKRCWPPACAYLGGSYGALMALNVATTAAASTAATGAAGATAATAAAGATAATAATAAAGATAATAAAGATAATGAAAATGATAAVCPAAACLAVGIAAAINGCCGFGFGLCCCCMIKHAPPEVVDACDLLAMHTFSTICAAATCKCCCSNPACNRHNQNPGNETEMQPLRNPGPSGASPVVTSQPRGRNNGEDNSRRRNNRNGGNGGSSQVVTSQPTGGGGNNRGALALYNREFNTASLTEVRTMMLGAADETALGLRRIIVKGQTADLEKNTLTPSKNFLKNPYHVSKKTVSSPSQKLKAPTNIINFVDSYESSLTKKHQPGRIGFIFPLTPTSIATFAYTHNDREKKRFITSSSHTGIKLSQVKTNINGLSLSIIFNPQQAGLTASFAASYSFGTAKTSRFYSYGPFYVKAKASPNVSMYGWIGQLGYNIPVSPKCTITPYVESVISMVHWNSYKEKASILPSAISSNKEQLAETSIGLRSSLPINPNIKLHSWIASITGIKTLSSMHSTIDIPILSWYDVSLPKAKQTYQKIELGLGYEQQLSDAFTFGLTASTQLNKNSKQGKYYATTYISYLF